MMRKLRMTSSFLLTLGLMLAPTQASSVTDIDAIKILSRVEDDPVSIRKQLRIDWNTPPETPGFTDEVVLWTLSYLVGGYEARVSRRCSELTRILDFAKEQKLGQTWVILKTWLASYQICGFGPDTAWPEIAAVTRENHWPDLQAMAGAELGFTWNETGHDEGLKILEEANQLAEQHTLAPTIEIMVRGYTASILGMQGQHAKAVALQNEIILHPALEHLRLQKSALLFNLGMELMKSEDPAEFQLAKDNLSLSRRLSAALGDPYNRAMGEAVLSSIALREGRAEEAATYAESAYSLFVELENTRWESIALVRLTHALITQKRYSEAEIALGRAEKLFAPQEIPAHLRAAEFYAQIYAGKGQWQEGFLAQKKYIELYAQLQEQMAADERAKQVAQMELDIAETKNRELQKTNELQAERLQGAQRIKQFLVALIFGLAAISALLFYSIRQTRKARERKQKIRRILDHIDEGIVTIDSQMKIEAEYSHFLQIFLGESRDLTGLDALDVLLNQTLLSNEERSIIRETLRATLGESALAWDLNEGQLPREVLYDDDPPRVAAMHWVPILDRNGTLQSVLLGIRDISMQRQLEQEVAHNRAHAMDLQKELNEILEVGVQPVRPLISRARNCLQKLQKPAESLTELHTIKGIARGLQLHVLSQGTHELESALKAHPDHHEAALHFYQDILHGYEEILKMFELDRLPLRAHRMHTLLDAVQPILPGLIVQLESAHLQLGGLVVVDEVGTWDPELLRTLPDLLLHALTNAADHGYILNPDADGKPIFHLTARPLPLSRIAITVRDHGAGLKRENVETLARKHDFIPAADQEIWDVLFQRDVSTAAATTQTSGRGWGLTAIHETVHNLQGSVHIRPARDGKGTELLLELPTSVLRKSA